MEKNSRQRGIHFRRGEPCEAVQNFSFSPPSSSALPASSSFFSSLSPVFPFSPSSSLFASTSFFASLSPLFSFSLSLFLSVCLGLPMPYGMKHSSVVHYTSQLAKGRHPSRSLSETEFGMIVNSIRLDIFWMSETLTIKHSLGTASQTKETLKIRIKSSFSPNVHH